MHDEAIHLALYFRRSWGSGTRQDEFGMYGILRQGIAAERTDI